MRYVDDFLLFSNDKKELWAWKGAINDFLPGLRLTLHQKSSTVYPVSNGIPFLGFVTYPTHRLLKRRNGVAFARRFRHQLRLLAAGEIELSDLENAVQGWIAHAAHGNTYGLRRVLISSQAIPSGSRFEEPASSDAATFGI